jgi:hypothetical protein
LGVDQAISDVRAQVRSLDNSDIYLGGHGLGGAVAQLNLCFAGYGGRDQYIEYPHSALTVGGERWCKLNTLTYD